MLLKSLLASLPISDIFFDRWEGEGRVPDELNCSPQYNLNAAKMQVGLMCNQFGYQAWYIPPAEPSDGGCQKTMGFLVSQLNWATQSKLWEC